MTRPVRSRTSSSRPCSFSSLAAVGGAAVLPDERVVERLAGLRVPGDHGLALVGDPDRLQLGPLDAGVGDRVDRHPAGHLPDLRGVVLDAAGPREVLAELGVRAAGDPALLVEDEAGRAGRALVDGEDQVRGGYPRPAHGGTKTLARRDSGCRFGIGRAHENHGRSPDGINRDRRVSTRPTRSGAFEGNGQAKVVQVAGQTIGRGTFEPGWRWSENVKPIAGTDSCEVFHLGYVLSGRMKVFMDDGSESEVGAR